VEGVPTPGGRDGRRPERLAPQPPADGRDAPDPAVVHDGDRWAIFSTQVGFLNVPVALSDDLREWSQPVEALPELPDWAEWGRTWAPGVLRQDNGFVLYFAARSGALGVQCIGAATADSIEGPYTRPRTVEEAQTFLSTTQSIGRIEPAAVLVLHAANRSLSRMRRARAHPSRTTTRPRP
jgi:beta-xylosidase